MKPDWHFTDVEKPVKLIGFAALVFLEELALPICRPEHPVLAVSDVSTVAFSVLPPNFSPATRKVRVKLASNVSVDLIRQ
jgi:hypothetical protein